MPHVAHDFGLLAIAQHLGKLSAVETYWDGAEAESVGDIKTAISLYTKSYRMWPALDSQLLGGLPIGVRDEVLLLPQPHPFTLLDVISVPLARQSKVGYSQQLLTSSDLAEICKLSTGTVDTARHDRKLCTFLNNPLHHLFEQSAVLPKLLQFAAKSWAENEWGGEGGPLQEIKGGVESLNIRVVEHWDYQVGGGLVDDVHYDCDSVITIVCLLEAADEGGVFRTFEADDTHLEHHLEVGDSVCFVSHKYHNVTPVTGGKRRSLIVELWQCEKGQLNR